MMDFLDSLNDQQREATISTENPLLVLAGAGTGKTKTLTSRIGYVLESQLAQQHEILSVTFTNKAAREMQNRVESLVGGPVIGMWLGTFHSIGARMLRQNAEHIGLNSSFSIVGVDDQLKLLKNLLDEEFKGYISEKSTKKDLKKILSVIQNWKDKGYMPHAVPSEESYGQNKTFALEIYEKYQARLQELNAVDFGDILMHCVQIFLKCPEILQKFQQQFKYILVDEYQDTNSIQYIWLRMLSKCHQNICCVGDDDQSIYGWRGAEIQNVLRFEHDFPNAKIIKLECNYRSTQEILHVADKLISNNIDRLGKTLWTDAKGDNVQFQEYWNGREEAAGIGRKISIILSDSDRQIAILIRSGFHSRIFEEQFISIGINYILVGGVRFYERQEIKDLIAYLRLVINHNDDLAFERVINVPKRGIGAASLKKIRQSARSDGISCFEAANQMIFNSEFTPKLQDIFYNFAIKIQDWKNESENISVSELVTKIAHESEYIKMLEDEKTEEARDRMDNIEELINVLKGFDSAEKFLEHISLISDVDSESQDSMQVKIMTFHAAKGLEFDYVFLPCWEEGSFPNQRVLDSCSQSQLEEERRLAYVGITRAKRHLLISYAKSRMMGRGIQSMERSRFIDEIVSKD